jgi:hypothetical protein
MLENLFGHFSIDFNIIEKKIIVEILLRHVPFRKIIVQRLKEKVKIIELSYNSIPEILDKIIKFCLTYFQILSHIFHYLRIILPIHYFLKRNHIKFHFHQTQLF